MSCAMPYCTEHRFDGITRTDFAPVFRREVIARQKHVPIFSQVLDGLQLPVTTVIPPMASTHTFYPARSAGGYARPSDQRYIRGQLDNRFCRKPSISAPGPPHRNDVILDHCAVSSWLVMKTKTLTVDRKHTPTFVTFKHRFRIHLTRLLTFMVNRLSYVNYRSLMH